MPSSAGLRILRREPTDPGPAAGGVLVLVHGSLDRATSFTRLMARLPEWEIVSYDRRGYAQSSHLGPPNSFSEQIDDLLEVLEQETDGGPVIAFGHSLGGNIVLAAAADGASPIAAALVWEPPQPWLPFWPVPARTEKPEPDLGPEDRAERFMRRMIGDHVWERLPSATRAQRRAEGHTLDAEARTTGVVPLFDPLQVLIPVTVGRGGVSPTHQRRSARELAGSLRHGELADIAEAGHGAHLSHPSQVAELIRRAARRVM